MANNDPRQVANLDIISSLAANDKVLIVESSNSHVGIASINVLFSTNVLSTNNLLIINSYTPTDSTGNAVANSIWSDGSYIYFAVANGNIKRVALSTF